MTRRTATQDEVGGKNEVYKAADGTGCESMSNSLFNCLSPQRAVGSGSICLDTDLVTIES